MSQEVVYKGVKTIENYRSVSPKGACLRKVLTIRVCLESFGVLVDGHLPEVVAHGGSTTLDSDKLLTDFNNI